MSHTQDGTNDPAAAALRRLARLLETAPATIKVSLQTGPLWTETSSADYPAADVTWASAPVTFVGISAGSYRYGLTEDEAIAALNEDVTP